MSTPAPTIEPPAARRRTRPPRSIGDVSASGEPVGAVGGRDNATIARRLFLSDKTVRNHVSACLAKLQVATRAEAVALARDAGLGAPR